MHLKDKTVLVTGGTKGIGAATAVLLAGAGANVAIAARHSDEAAETVQSKIASRGGRCLILQADLGKPEDAARIVEETVAEFGSLDVLVHSAGGGINGGLFEITPEDWLTGFDVHVHAVFYLTRAAIPYMKKKQEGAIILISSVAGIRAIKTNVAYQVVKGAIPQFTRALAFEFADDNIRTNCVAPGIIRTDFHAAMSSEAKKNNLENRIPLHREGTPDQVAALIQELVTNDFITGECFTIDGGMTMRIP